MRNLYKNFLAALCLSPISLSIFPQTIDVRDKKITFHDYKEFIFYVRDSVAREILSKQISNFST